MYRQLLDKSKRRQSMENNMALDDSKYKSVSNKSPFKQQSSSNKKKKLGAGSFNRVNFCSSNNA